MKEPVYSDGITSACLTLFGTLVVPGSGLARTVHLHQLYGSGSKLKAGQMVHLAKTYCPAFV